jgi:hypothetical protein
MTASSITNRAPRVSPLAPLLQLIRGALPPAERWRRLHDGDRLGDLGIGSLRVLSLVMDLEDAYALAPEDLGEIGAHTTLGTLIRMCLRGPAGADEPLTIH